MKSTNQSLNFNNLKEIDQKEDSKAECINKSKEEESAEKLLENLEANNKESPTSITKTIPKINSVKNINPNIWTHNNIDNPSEKEEIKKHQRCVPLEIYTKVYQDKQTLINKVELLNKEINTLSKDSKNDEIKILDNKYKNLIREKTSIENILLNQEKYVSKLKKKIEKLEKQIMKKNEEIVEKDNNIVELNDKIEELNNKMINMKQNFKLVEKKEIMKLNDKITTLSNEIEIKQSKIEYIEKRHKNLQVKYLKLLGDKRKIAHDKIPFFKYSIDREKDKISEISNSTRSKNIESYKSIKKENMDIKISKNGNNSRNGRTNNNIHLPEILQNKNSKMAFSLKKERKNKNIKNNIKSNALKDLNNLLSDFSDDGGENKKKDEDIESDDNDNNDNEEYEESEG